MPTVGVPASLLLGQSTFPDWCLTSTATARDQITEAVASIREHGLAFLERYSSMNEVALQFESENPSDWFTFTSEQRIRQV